MLYQIGDWWIMFPVMYTESLYFLRGSSVVY